MKTLSSPAGHAPPRPRPLAALVCNVCLLVGVILFERPEAHTAELCSPLLTDPIHPGGNRGNVLLSRVKHAYLFRPVCYETTASTLSRARYYANNDISTRYLEVTVSHPFLNYFYYLLINRASSPISMSGSGGVKED